MRVNVVSDIANVPAHEWDALVGDDDPFVEHAFLLALETSGSVGGDSGWTPQHVIARDDDGRLVGALPLYAKTHSYGEYIFDWGWASAAHRAGIRYYPKLVSMVPFTPTTGRRFLTATHVNRVDMIAALLGGAREVAGSLRASSIHLNFLADDEAAALEGVHGFLSRLTVQFHFVNDRYADLEAYLATFRAKTRKEARRERRRAADAGLAIVTRDGPSMNDDEWAALERFYRDTCDRKGNDAYLTPVFFARIREAFAHRVVAVLAYDGARPVAGTLNFEKGRRLYGRYWGADAAYDALHFELCYWRLIERAIERGHTRFEAGAQGLHKLRRGLMPAAIRSAHFIEHPGLRSAVGDYLERETAAARAEIEALAHHGPFRRGG